MNERKPISPEGSMMVQSTSGKSGTSLNREIQSKIGQILRASYNDIVDQGVPDRFSDLLRRLDGEVKGNK